MVELHHCNSKEAVRQQEHLSANKSLAVPPVQANRVDTALSAVQSSTIERQMALQQLVDTARIVGKKKRVRVAAKKTCQDRKEKEASTINGNST